MEVFEMSKTFLVQNPTIH